MTQFNGCRQQYFENWKACYLGHTLSQEEFDAWMMNHCFKCPYMSDVCMADEIVDNIDDVK